MGLFDMFSMKSVDQRQKEEREFEKKVFPLGMEQRDSARKVLSEVCIASAKSRDTERLFAYISAKDKYYSEDEPIESIAAARISLKKQTWLKADDHKLVLALILLEQDITSLDDYPSAEAVRAKAESL